MTRTQLDFLFEVASPWIYIGTGEPERVAWIPSMYYTCDSMSVCVRKLRGQKMKTTQALMDEFGAALQFFDGFGENWNALEECLCYLDEWLPAEAYVLVVERAEDVLRDSSDEAWLVLLGVLHRAAASWASPITDGDRFDRPAIPFHVLFHVSSDRSGAVDRLVSLARAEGVPIRL